MFAEKLIITVQYRTENDRRRRRLVGLDVGGCLPTSLLRRHLFAITTDFRGEYRRCARCIAVRCSSADGRLHRLIEGRHRIRIGRSWIDVRGLSLRRESRSVSRLQTRTVRAWATFSTGWWPIVLLLILVFLQRNAFRKRHAVQKHYMAYPKQDLTMKWGLEAVDQQKGSMNFLWRFQKVTYWVEDCLESFTTCTVRTEVLRFLHFLVYPDARRTFENCYGASQTIIYNTR